MLVALSVPHLPLRPRQTFFGKMFSSFSSSYIFFSAQFETASRSAHFLFSCSFALCMHRHSDCRELFNAHTMPLEWILQSFDFFSVSFFSLSRLLLSVRPGLKMSCRRRCRHTVFAKLIDFSM